MTNTEKKAVNWIINGEMGTSSRVIFAVMMTGMPPANKFNQDVPYDPSDFRRCRVLLDLVPEWRKRLHEIAAVLPKWKPLVDHWDELDALYDEECGQDEAPKLYERMKELRS